MSGTWTWSAQIAILLGGGLFVIFFGPMLALQSRQFGRLTFSRTLASAALSIYLVAIVAYTLLPLPSRSWCATHDSKPVQWQPFHSIHDILTDTHGMSLLATLRSTAVLQVVFNVILFIPWGAFVRRYLGRSILLATASGFAVSVLIEATQGTGIWGIYDCAFRFADVDDVITNTSGALIGALIAPLALGWLPNAREDTARRREARPITAVRRLAGMIIDITAFFLLYAGLTVIYRLFVRYVLGEPLPSATSWDGNWIWALASGLLLVIVPALLGNATFGQQAVWLRPSFPDGNPLRRIVRVLAGCGGWIALYLIAIAPPYADTSTGGWLQLVQLAWVLAAIGSVFASKSRRGLSFGLAGAQIVDSRAQAAATEVKPVPPPVSE